MSYDCNAHIRPTREAQFNHDNATDTAEVADRGRQNAGEHMRYVCFVRLIPIALTSFATATLAEDVNNGRDIALHQCAACHIVTRSQRNELADAPPFVLIGSKNGFDASSLAFALLEPHPKMNFALTQREAADVAAYIITLAK
jgi:mono/diheme cytochrome c family protein